MKDLHAPVRAQGGSLSEQTADARIGTTARGAMVQSKARIFLTVNA
jgi:hypothetical protein